MVFGFHPWVYVQLALRRESDFAAAMAAVGGGLGSILGEVAAAGFEAIETMADLLASDEGEARHAEALGSSGLDLIGTSHNAPLWDPARRSEQLDFLGGICERLARLGGRHLGLSCVPPPTDRVKEPADWDAQAETLLALAKIARPLNILPNLHTYAADAADDYREVRETLGRVGPDDLAFGPDLAWLAWGGGDAVEVVTRFGDRTAFCHLRGRRGPTEWAEGLGEGIDDQAAIGAALRRAGFDGVAVFEPAFPDDAPTRPLAETWRASYGVLRAAFGACG